MHYLDQEEELLRSMARDHNITQTNLHNPRTWQILANDYNQYVSYDRRRTGLALRQKFKRMILDGQAELPPITLLRVPITDLYGLIRSTASSSDVYSNLDANMQSMQQPSNLTTNNETSGSTLDPALSGLGIMNLEPQRTSQIDPALESIRPKIGDENLEPSTAGRTLPFPSELIRNRNGQRP